MGSKRKPAAARLSLESLENRRLLAGDVLQNALAPEDVNADGQVTLTDMSDLVGRIAGRGGRRALFVDVNGDGRLGLSDAMPLLQRLRGEGEGDCDAPETADETEPTGETPANDDPTRNAEGESSEEDRDDLVTDPADEVEEEAEDSEEDGEHGDEEDVLDEDDQDDQIDDEDDETDEDEERETENDEDDERELRGPAGAFRDLSLIELLDDNANGSIEADETSERVWERLSAADANADNAVDQSELDAWREALRTERLQNRFADRDADDDGFLTENEVGERWETLSELDTDADGQVSLDEFLSGVDGLREARRADRIAARVDRFFANYDTDGDMLLAETEVGQRRWERLAPFDADENLGISRDEATTAFQQHVGRVRRVRRFV